MSDESKAPAVSVTAGAAEMFTVRVDRSWAVIFLNSGTGILSIVSDYGNYGYRWSDPGCEFKQFLTEIDDDYLVNKLSSGCDYFNSHKSTDAMLAAIAAATDLPTQDAKTLKDAVDNLDSYDAGSMTRSIYDYMLEGEEFAGDKHEWRERFANECIVMEHSPQITQFVANIWSVFRGHLKANIRAARPEETVT